MTRGRRVTLITGCNMPSADTESSLLVEALASLGVDSEIVAWSDERDWSTERLIVLRTPWDYTDRLTRFLEWITHVSSVSQLQNSAEVVRWNLNKRYLLELARRGVPIVPTEVSVLGDQAEASRFLKEFGLRHRTNEIIVKPTVGIKANGARRAAPDDPALALHLAAFLTEGDALVQPFVPAIRTTGEISLIFVGSTFTHAVRKLPKAGDFRVQDNHGGSVRPYGPTALEIETARAALAVAPVATTYARVDMVDFYGTPVVMELELIEPELFLRFSPTATDALASQLVIALG